MPAPGRSLTGRLLGILRSWWPVAAFLVPVLVAQTLWSGRYEVAGHAADHLQSATPVFPMTFLSACWCGPCPVVVVVIACCGCCWPRPSSVAWWVLVGNVRVIEAIDGATWTDAQASQLGPAR